MREVKKIKDRLLMIEDWIEKHEEPAGIPNILENMNFLLEAIRKDKDQFQAMRQQQEGERNTMNLLGKFLDENKLMEKWKAFFEAEQASAGKAAEEQGIKSEDKPEIKTL